MNPIRLLSSPKINLTLDVMGRDHQAGKHFINTFLYRVETLSDEIELKKRADDQNFIHCDFPGLSSGKLNTVMTALDLLGEKGWDVIIHKRIPVGAGLGGGSSNAGAVLKYFSERRKVPIDHMMEIARQIGADVPFFLLDDNLAYAEGFGDQILQSWTLPSLPIHIIQTGIRVSTPEAYDGLDLDHCGQNSVKTEALLTLLKESPPVSPELLSPYLHNDFDSSFFEKYPELEGQGSLCGSGGGMFRFI